VLPSIEEIKHNLDGTTERFDCRLVHREPDYVVICYLSDRPYAVGDVSIPEGSLTIGHYRSGSDYVFWEMYTPQAEPLGYYVHLCGKISIGDRCVEWYDMTMDVWFGSDGRFKILDEDELESSVESGQIDPDEASRIRRRARRLRDKGAAIAQQFKRFDPMELLGSTSMQPGC
jgi:predicted RNA-binding protein associated with RNAse of E/G family